MSVHLDMTIADNRPMSNINIRIHDMVNRVNLSRLNPGIHKISFSRQITTKEIIEIITGPAIRTPSLKEFFSFLRLDGLMGDNERVVYVEENIQTGDDVLVVTQRGPFIVPCLPVWDTNYKFIVSIINPLKRGFTYLIL